MVILDAVADAFTSVSVLVAAMFALFGLVRVRWGAAFESLLARRERPGPVLAVVATLPPGCIGVLAISRLYVQHTVSYGTVIAALVSTMGDTAWLLLAKDPLLTVVLKGGLAVLGCAVGLVVDHLGIRPGEATLPVRRTAVLAAVGAPGHHEEQALDATTGLNGRSHLPAGTVVDASPGEEPGPPSGRPALPPHRDVPAPLTVLFLVCLAVGLLLSLPATLHLVPEGLAQTPARFVGLVGTVVAVAIVLAARGRLVCGEQENSVERSMSEVLHNCSREAAFVTVWVSAVFLVWELGAAHLPLLDGRMPLEGVVGVVVAAAAGLIPACGVEILVSTLFVTGMLPGPALVAYLVSQDGNGFIPIATRRPRAAMHGTILTTLLALAVGLLLLVFS
jgi:hypothetical protein